MAKTKWDEETIKKRILALNEIGEELTCSRVKEIDKRLVGAAVSFFGNWGAAVEAAGLDYTEIRKKSKLSRSDKVRKWTKDIVIEKIREVAKTEKDMSYAFMKEKHSSLVAAACNYVGSWKKALNLAGFDYNEVQNQGRKSRTERERAWYKELLIEKLERLGATESAAVKARNPKFHALLMSHFKSWSKVMEQLRRK